jgi:hypothetical protein
MRTTGSIAAALLLSACAGTLPRPETLAPATGVTAVIYLIGDAGIARPGGEPVFQALSQDIRENAEGVERRIVFLGDNIYPSGLPPESEATSQGTERAVAEGRALAQIEVALETRTPTIFLPGNHDWDDSGDDGWEAVLRQERLMEGVGQGLVAWSPDDGCPGPEVHDLSQPIRLVLLDTEWWLREGDKPRHPTSSCPADSEEEVLAQLGDALRSAGQRQVLVLAHHPLTTGGPHGGHFSLAQHLFPLRAWKSWLWVPLPVIGSIYPIARKLGVNDQDTSSGRNRSMRSALGSVLAATPPLLYAAGHSHTLEVLEGGTTAGVLVVSGAGVLGHVDPIAQLEETLFRAPGRAGYVRLEFEQGRRVRLSVVTATEAGEYAVAWATYLELPR